MLKKSVKVLTLEFAIPLKAFSLNNGYACGKKKKTLRMREQ